MRVPDSLLLELIENHGELRTGPIDPVGIVRLAHDLLDVRKENERRGKALLEMRELIHDYMRKNYD